MTAEETMLYTTAERVDEGHVRIRVFADEARLRPLREVVVRVDPELAPPPLAAAAPLLKCLDDLTDACQQHTGLPANSAAVRFDPKDETRGWRRTRMLRPVRPVFHDVVDNGLHERQALRGGSGRALEEARGFAPQQGRSAQDVADSAAVGGLGLLGAVVLLVAIVVCLAIAGC